MTTKEIYNLKQASIAAMLADIQTAMEDHADAAHELGATRDRVCDLIEVEKDLTILLNKMAGA